MAEEVKRIHKEPHPYVNLKHLTLFRGRTVAFVGRVERIESGNLIMSTADRKNYISLFLPYF